MLSSVLKVIATKLSVAKYISVINVWFKFFFLNFRVDANRLMPYFAGSEGF